VTESKVHSKGTICEEGTVCDRSLGAAPFHSHLMV
jgi:hypothetical protein